MTSQQNLLDYVKLEDLQSLALIGMSKNAGKTTCLNHIISAWIETEQKRPLALTSIGRDGESEDVVSGREKPRIYIPAGTLIATAEGALSRSDTLLDILDFSKVRTAFGEVVICRALSDGYVELAGPSASEEVAIIADLIRKHAPDALFIIDGALSRKSQAGSGNSEAVILAVSAGTSAAPAILADKAAFALRLLRTPPITGMKRDELALAIQNNPQARVVVLGDLSCKTLSLPNLVGFGKDVAKQLDETSNTLFLRGALTEMLLKELLKAEYFRNLCLVVEDGTRLFINSDSYRKLSALNVELAALDPLEVRLVYLNPTTSSGHLQDSAPLLEALREKINDIPVLDLGPANM
jgi:hypothetical protein